MATNKHVRESTVAAKNAKKHKRSSLEPVSGLSFQGCCRDMAVQHGKLCGRGTALSVAETKTQ